MERIKKKKKKKMLMQEDRTKMKNLGFKKKG